MALGVTLVYPDEFNNLVIDNIEEFEALPESAKVAYCLHSLEAQVNNGGFDQYFFNSSGLFVQQTLQSLSIIGALKTKSLLEQAISIAYPNGYPGDPARHQIELFDSNEMEELLEPIDQAFFAYEEPLTDLVNRYLHRDT